jgi:hypothetical protein
VACRGLLQGVLLILSGKQEVASGSPAQDTQLLPAYWKKKADFVENPLGFGRFQGKIIKTAHFLRFGDSNGVQ